MKATREDVLWCYLKGIFIMFHIFIKMQCHSKQKKRNNLVLKVVCRSAEAYIKSLCSVVTVRRKENRTGGCVFSQSKRLGVE